MKWNQFHIANESEVLLLCMLLLHNSLIKFYLLFDFYEAFTYGFIEGLVQLITFKEKTNMKNKWT